MDSASALVAIDVGTSGARASAFSTTGQVLAEVRRSYPTDLPAEGLCWRRPTTLVLVNGVGDPLEGWENQLGES